MAEQVWVCLPAFFCGPLRGFLCVLSDYMHLKFCKICNLIKKRLMVQPCEDSKGLMAVGIKSDPAMSVIVQTKNECGHKLTPNRAIRALFAVAQVLEARFIIT